MIIYKEIEDEDKKDEDGKTKEKVTLESLSTQIAGLQKTIQEMKKG